MKSLKRGPEIPLTDLEVLSSSAGALIVLWCIREKGRISFAALFDMLCAGEEVPAPNNRGTQLTGFMRAMRLLSGSLNQLIEAGLVEAAGGQLDDIENARNAGDIKQMMAYREQITFHVRPTLEMMQELFDISLTEYASGRESVRAEPTFGRPKSGEWPEVFVVMPFLEVLKPIYDNHILPVVRGLDLTCKRGDDFFSDESIIDEIWSAIYYSTLCIAECTGRNPNVFYEMGLAHTLGRPCILIAQSTTDIPFDVRHKRIIIYENTPAGLEKFRTMLTRAIQEELGLEHDKLLQILDKL